MTECMVPDGVAGLSDLADDVRMPARVVANEEECCPHVVFREHFQQLLRVGIVWSVVEGECKFFRSAREANKRTAVQLPGWRHRFITGYSNRRRRSPCH